MYLNCNLGSKGAAMTPTAEREPVQVEIDGTPKKVKPVAGAIIRGRGKHFERFRDQLIEVAEKNSDFELTIK